MDRIRLSWLILAFGIPFSLSSPLRSQTYHSALYPPAITNPLGGRIQMFGCALDRNPGNGVLGNAYLVGYNTNTTLQVPSQIVVSAFAPAGGLSWSNIYGGGAARAAAVDSTSAVVVATTEGVLRLGSNGSLIASYPISGWTPEDVAVDASDNVYVTGSSGNSVYTVRLNKTAGGGLSLAQGWPQLFSGASTGTNQGKALVVKDAVYVAGNGYRQASTGQDALLLKYSLSGGAPLAQFWFDTPNEDSSPADFLNDLAVDAGNNVFATGTSSIGTPSGPENDYLTLRVNSGFPSVPAWYRTYTSPRGGTLFSATDDQAQFIALDASEQSVYVTGTAKSDIQTFKYSTASGTQLASSRFDSSNSIDAAAGLFVASGGQVFVGGASSTRYVLLALAGDFSAYVYGTPSYVDMASLPNGLAGTAPSVACLQGRNTAAAPALFTGGFYKITNPSSVPLQAMGIHWIYP